MTETVASHIASKDNVRSPKIRVEWIDNFDQLESIEEQWNDLLGKSGSDVYFTIDWMRIWWRHYGNNRVLKILLAWQDHELVAGFPIGIRQIGWGPLRIRLAQFVGADSTIPVLSPPIVMNSGNAVLSMCLDAIINNEAVDAFSLSPLSGNITVGHATRQLSERSGLWAIKCDEVIGPHTTFNLPGSFDAYLNSLAKRQRGNYRRDLKVLSRKVRLETHLYTGPEAVERLEQFMELHRTQWKAVGRLGHFEDWPGSVAFNQDLVESMSSSGQVCIFDVTGDGETLAMQYCFVHGDTCYWRLPARRSGEEFDRMGLGRIGLLKMIEALIDMGVRRVEAGPGHYDYKVKHGGEEHQLTRLVIVRRRLLSQLRAKVLLVWADVLHLAYYRLWFIKSASRFGSQRALWGPWIRTRI